MQNNNNNYNYNIVILTLYILNILSERVFYHILTHLYHFIPPIDQKTILKPKALNARGKP